MDLSKSLSPTPTELIDWMNDEGLLELDWDFPEEGDLFAAGLDEQGLLHLLSAVEDEYGVELSPADVAASKPFTPLSLAGLIAGGSN